MASLLAHGVRLPLVLGHASVHAPAAALAMSHLRRLVCIFVLDNVRADGRLEDIGERVGVLAGRPIGAVDSDGRTRHRCCCVVSCFVTPTSLASKFDKCSGVRTAKI